jgi:hypothetical protein
VTSVTMPSRASKFAVEQVLPGKPYGAKR